MSPDPGKVAHINSATLIMGVTGSGKSALLATLIRWVWETYHLQTLYYTTDGGGFPTDVQALQQKGIARVWRMRTRDLPDGSLSFETCMRAAQGWWPKRINAATGETEPGVQLVPPITESYEMRCPNGHLVKRVPFQSLLTASLCPTCKLHVTRETMQVTKTAHRTKGFETVGAVCYDGLTSMLAWMEQDMGQRSGRLELKGEEGAIGGKVISGDMKFGGVTRSHVGFVQSRAHELALNSNGIPYLMVPPTWTALTLETTDEGGLSIRGPKLSGKAKTDEAPAWFGNCFETMVRTTDKGERQFRLQLAEYVDEAGVRHLAKNRATPGALPEYLEDPPLKPGQEGQTAFTQFNLGLVYTLLERARVDAMAAIDEQYPDAPGLPEGIVEVGEAVVVQPAPAPAVTASAPIAAPTAPPRSAPPRAPTPKAASAAPVAPAPTPTSTATPPTELPAAEPVDTPPVTGTAPAPRPASAAPKKAPATSTTAPTAAAPATAPVTAPKPAVRTWAPPGAPKPPAKPPGT